MRALDVAVVGAGAAGLAAAIFAARRRPDLTIVALDGAASLGAKILVSGGGRCNVTNAAVSEHDFAGKAPFVRHVLRGFDAAATREFFFEIGVGLHEEEGGKLFPDSHKARTVLAALIQEAEGRGVRLLCRHRVKEVRRSEGFVVLTEEGAFEAARVVLATGGLSLPKSGSDGSGYRIAKSLGHSLVQTTPALVPLVLTGTDHSSLQGVSHPATLTLREPLSGERLSITGALLWTHFGVSGPAVLDMSRHILRARAEGRDPRLTASLLPGETFESVDSWLVERGRGRPRESPKSALAQRLPKALAEAAQKAAGIPPGSLLSQLPREKRHRLAGLLVDWPLPVKDSRGYDFAEVTAGGIPTSEVDPKTLESRICPGLHIVGEILDVDGRIGGFNFQWAWSSAFAAAGGLVSGGSTRTLLQKAKA